MPGPRRAATARPGRGPGAGAPAGGRRRASHSLEAVLTAAVALLDEAGEQALTFRALAARLGGGVGSVYWYVSGKDELLDRAADHVLTGVLADSEKLLGHEDPIEDLRALAVTLFDATVDRPWLGAYFMRSPGDEQPNQLLFFERMGQQAMRLGLPPKQTFDAVSAVLGFVIGTAADLGQQPPQEVLDGSVSRDDYVARYADAWRAMDPATYPFLHFILDEFAVHDDREQFRAGLDLLLAGLRLQAGG
ncbi:TetR/AcrR family transcriptional regulator [Motilibacter deserti]|uniref:TetR/AcrR family transcriptional regulator n=1 Tax=Motilibacter deserti TaxID=2714956 RepID=A0ABX0GXZ4_9ACTN|nr:TetR/AcrR family transcriptional regulator [Motilibacter deserti]NHC15697.1 TetR/AcrR family transcriptional regulator [Motilibacter deserti]